MKRIHLAFILLCNTFASQAVALNESRFLFNSDPSKSQDHLVVPFPESTEIVGDGLTLSVQASTDLTEWNTIDVIHFELSQTNGIEGFVIDSELQAVEGGFDLVWIKRKEIYASDFIPTDEPLSYVSDSSKEIFIFIGNYVFSEVESGNLTLTVLEYTPRTQIQFFRMIPSNITITE